MPFRHSEQERWFAEEVLPHDGTFRAYLKEMFKTLPAVEIEDLVQEAYVRILRAHEAGPIASPKAYMYAIGRNRALNLLRAQRNKRLVPFTEIRLESVLNEEIGIPESLAHAEDVTLLIQALQSLPNRCRQIMTLRKIRGFSQREVAAALGISENTVETQGAIGLKKCEEFFRCHREGGTHEPGS